MTEINRLRRRYMIASLGIVVAAAVAYAMGAAGFGAVSTLGPLAASIVCVEVVRRTAARIERAYAVTREHVLTTSVRQVREGDVLEGYEGLGPVTAVAHRRLRSHVFTENVGLIFGRFERVRVLAGE